MEKSYPLGFQPDHPEIVKLDGTSITVPGVNMKFKPWTGKPIRDDFGGKPVLEYDGRPVFAELAIRRMAFRAGWSALWAEVYPPRRGGPAYYTDWKEDLTMKEQSFGNLDSPHQRELQERIARQNGSSYSGCWDVIAWKGERTLYIESKRHTKDYIRGTQAGWLVAGLAAGLAKDDFLVVQWTLEK